MKAPPGDGTQPKKISNRISVDLLRFIEAVDRRRERGEDQERVGGKFQPKAPNGATGNSAEITAKIVGTSHRKVERARRKSNRAILKWEKLGIITCWPMQILPFCRTGFW
jgi:hypothetical protein